MIREMNWSYLKRPGRGVPPSRPGPPQFAVVILTYKSHDLLEQCLASVGQLSPELPVYAYQNSGVGYPGRAELVVRHPEVHWSHCRDGVRTWPGSSYDPPRCRRWAVATSTACDSTTR